MSQCHIWENRSQNTSVSTVLERLGNKIKTLNNEAIQKRIKILNWK